MKARGAEADQGLAVLGRAVAGMAFKAVAREAGSQPADQRIPVLLGKHAGRRDGAAVAIALHKGDLSSLPRTQWQHTIHDHQLGPMRKPLQRPQHRPLGSQTDAMAINLGRGGLPEGPGQCLLLDPGTHPFALAGAEPLAVGETISSQRRQRLGRQHHGGGEHRTEQTAAAHFIDTRATIRGMAAPRISGAGPQRQRSDAGRGAATAAAWLTIVGFGRCGFSGGGSGSSSGDVRSGISSEIRSGHMGDTDLHGDHLRLDARASIGLGDEGQGGDLHRDRDVDRP